ncbi:MAG: 1,4-alpha-glucan branching protein domain-containing protein [Candidatus Neomarinimicrobiota bacterium]
MKGYFSLVLHSHLPYVINHGEWPHGMDWLYEAAAETYIPLLSEFQSLISEGISPNVTIGLTPILTEQLASEKFKHGFVHYLDQKIAAAEENLAEFENQGQEHLKQLADMWKGKYSRTKSYFLSQIDRNIVMAFKKMQDGGHLEIITCAATHGYFPLLGTDESIDAQVHVGKETYRRHFGRDPKGIWLPECAYRPSYEWTSPIAEYPKKIYRRGVEEFLFKYDIQYFIVDKHLILGGKNRGVYLDRFDSLKALWKQFEKNWKPLDEEKERSIYENYLVSSTGTSRAAVVYGRHEESSLQVWSGEYGYPGDGRYLDFHKKHFPGGHRYWKVTSAKADLADKQEYYPEDVEDALENQATHFVELLGSYIDNYHRESGKVGILTAPFDTELFGHWWHEGPRFIGKVLRKLNKNGGVQVITLGNHLEKSRPQTVISMPEGSWGQGGFHYIWLNEWTEWTWKHVYAAEDQMVELANKYAETKDDVIRRILNQLAREVLLIESSDWQFLISTWSARDYAESRLTVHAEHIKRLAKILISYDHNKLLTEREQVYLAKIEEVDDVFPDIDFTYWRSLKPRETEVVK